eukprot:jgi/Botrbrau1/17912/Bobra.50_1s0013.1
MDNECHRPLGQNTPTHHSISFSHSQMSVSRLPSTERGVDEFSRQMQRWDSKGGDDQSTVPFSDCALVCDSGRRFPSSKSVLALRSKVLKSMLTGCGDGSSVGVCLDVHLKGDTEEDVEIFWSHLFFKSQVWNPAFVTSRRDVQLRIVKAIACLAKMAEKYDCKGILEEIQSLFLRNGVLEAAIDWRPQTRSLDSTTTYGLWCSAVQFDLRELRTALEPFLPGGSQQPIYRRLPDFNASPYQLSSVGDEVIKRLFTLLVERAPK